MRNALHAKSRSNGEATSLLLQRLHVELAALAKGVLTTQHVLSPILSQLPSMPAEAIEEAQRLDLIEQSLRDLAAVTALAASTTPDFLDLRALGDICLLGDLAARLRGEASEAQTSADLELF